MPNKCDGVAKLKRLEQRLDRQFSLFGIRFGLDGDIFAWNAESRPGRPKGGEATGLRALLATIENRFTV